VNDRMKKRLQAWARRMLGVEAVVVEIGRAGTVSNENLAQMMAVDDDALVLRGIREVYARIEATILDGVFDGRPEDRMLNLARMAGAQELLRAIFEWQKRGNKAEV